MREPLLCVALIIGCASSHKADNGDSGVDGAGQCAPDGITQCAGSTYETCTGGAWTTTMDCPAACIASLGCTACSPGQTFCQGGNVWSCDATGNPGMMVQACTGQAVCQGGGCVDACTDAATNRSYIGCEYWAVDLHNAIDTVAAPFLGDCSIYGIPGLQIETLNICVKSANPNRGAFAGQCDPPGNSCPAGYACTTNTQACVLDAQHSPFAIVLSNPQTKDAHVTVTGAGGQTITATITAGQVAPIKPQMNNAIPGQWISGTGQAKKAYKIVSDLPIVAYQFNPLDNVNVFSNDASLLIPRTAYDVNYYGMAWPTLDRRNPAPGSDPFYGYLTVVAWQDNTKISVTPTTAVQASATQATIAAGATANFTLNAFDVLNLEAAGAGDLTGTYITSTNGMTYGAFGGHVAADFGETTPPDANHPSGPCCADHLEEVLFPTSTWGMTFAIARTVQRTNEPDYLRIMAQKPGTSVTFSPAPSVMVSGNCAALGPGQYCDVKTAGDMEITANQPILVGHYIESSIWTDALGTSFVGTGDPSMSVAVPIEQYRTDYTILIPSAYGMNYLSISAAPTGGVTLDGTAVTLTPFPGGATHRAARVPVTAGQHTIHCADGCGLQVYGYDNAVSYMFPGGLDLKQIVIQ